MRTTIALYIATAVVMIVGLIAAPAKADFWSSDDTSIYVGINITKHFGFSSYEGSFNDVHPYITVQNGSTYVSAFINSHDNIGVSLYEKFKDEDGNYADFGVVYGYDVPILPMWKFGHKHHWFVPTPFQGGGLIIGDDLGEIKF